MRRWNSAQLAEMQQQQQNVRQPNQQRHQQPFPATSLALRRMLSLQRPHNFLRNNLPSQATQAATAKPQEMMNLPKSAPQTPPPLPPRGSRRPRTASEFSSIVLDVNRLFEHHSHRPRSGTASSTSSSLSSSKSSTHDNSDGAESDDEGASEEDDEDEKELVFEADENRVAIEVRVEVAGTGARVEPSAATDAAAAAAEVREAEEAEDVYTEIPLRHGNLLTLSPRLVMQPHLPQHQTRPQSYGQSREFLDTLETLKTPTLPDSDQDSPTVYTTDCEDRSYYHLGHRLRNHSSLLLSGGEESVYSGVSRLDPPHMNRWASPVPNSHQLLSAGANDQSGLRRMSPSPRISVVSQPAALTASRPSSAVERKVSRASRALKLNYEFHTSSGKVSLQKLGSQSLARLEDLAQVGSKEQGTNYKRSYVSLYQPLHPLFLAMKIFGAFHTRQNNGKAAAKFTHSYIYSGCVMLAMWFNVARYLFVYDWGQEQFDSLMFLKLTHHTIYIQSAVALTVMFKASGKFPSFFKACHEFMSRRHSLTYRYTLARRAKVSAITGVFVVALEVTVFLVWATQTDGEYYKTFLRPYTLVIPWNNTSKGVLGFFYLAFDTFMAAAWVFPALLFCNFTWIFEREFRYLAHRLRLACTNDHIFVGDIEKFRLESWRISKLVSGCDQLFNFYVFTVFITDILSVCLILYNLIVGSFPGSGIVIEVWFWLGFAMLRLFGVTISASRVNQAACSPLNVIQNMNLKDYAVNPAKIGQLMIFLNKLTIGNIGFTAWNLFTLSRTSTMTIAALIITYTVLFVKLGATYGQDDRLKPPRTTSSPGFATTLINNGSVGDSTTSFLTYY